MIFKLLVQCIFMHFVFSISEHEILIVVSYDAFRYNYFDPNVTPNMVKIRKTGTFADYLINVFPTKTFPNHHSIATGLYPESHGVLSNHYYDTTIKKIMHIGPEMYDYAANVVPIWRLNEDVSDSRHSGAMMWPGSAFPYQGKSITYLKEYDPSIDFFERVDTIMSWILNPKKPANLIMLYFEEPDSHGHAFGPNSEVLHDFLRKLDNVTVYLKKKLEKNNLADKVNVIHLSDHGMAAVTPPRFINITQYLEPDTYIHVGASPCFQFYPKEGQDEEVYQRLRNASLTNFFKVYKIEDYPSRWHYKKCTRAPPILAMAHVGYAFDDLIDSAPKYADKFNFTLTNTSEFGVHGYDYTEPQMRPFFMARGPHIKKQHKVPPFHTVDLFNLFCELLKIPATPNNGTFANIKDILSNGNNSRGSGFFSLLAIIVGGVITVMVFVICAAMITLMMIKRQQSITTTAALNKRFPQTFQTHVEAQHLLEPEDA